RHVVPPSRPARVLELGQELAHPGLRDGAHAEVTEGRQELRLQYLLVLSDGGGLPARTRLLDPLRGKDCEERGMPLIRLPLPAVPGRHDFTLKAHGLVARNTFDRALSELTLGVIPPELIPRSRPLHRHGVLLLFTGVACASAGVVASTPSHASAGHRFRCRRSDPLGSAERTARTACIAAAACPRWPCPTARGRARRAVAAPADTERARAAPREPKTAHLRDAPRRPRSGRPTCVASLSPAGGRAAWPSKRTARAIPRPCIRRHRRRSPASPECRCRAPPSG